MDMTRIVTVQLISFGFYFLLLNELIYLVHLFIT